jgi:hypothetical protein
MLTISEALGFIPSTQKSKAKQSKTKQVRCRKKNIVCCYLYVESKKGSHKQKWRRKQWLPSEEMGRYRSKNSD